MEVSLHSVQIRIRNTFVINTQKCQLLDHFVVSLEMMVQIVWQYVTEFALLSDQVSIVITTYSTICLLFPKNMHFFQNFTSKSLMRLGCNDVLEEKRQQALKGLVKNICRKSTDEDTIYKHELILVSRFMIITHINNLIQQNV